MAKRKKVYISRDTRVEGVYNLGLPEARSWKPVVSVMGFSRPQPTTLHFSIEVTDGYKSTSVISNGYGDWPRIRNNTSRSAPLIYKRFVLQALHFSKSASGIHNALYILPRALYTNLTHTFIYFVAMLNIEEKYE